MICSKIWTRVLQGCAAQADPGYGGRRGALVALAFALAPVSAASADLKVFAAASLTEAMDAVLASCETATGLAATGIYAGSGTLARQIGQGAPADLFISANPLWMNWLEERGLLESQTRNDLLGNALVVIATPEAKTKLDAEGARDPLSQLGGSVLATAEMESVPAGIYARQALEASGYPLRAPLHRIIQGANVREVLNWVVKGEADLGIVYRSDATRRETVKVAKTFAADAHDPIRYPAAVISDGQVQNAKRLLACFIGEEASQIFDRYGFSRL